MNDIFKDLVVVKRSGQRVAFNGPKIAVAIKYAFDNSNSSYDEENSNEVYTNVLDFIKQEYQNRKTINVEDIQNIIEKTLLNLHYDDVYEAFNAYRLKRAESREAFSVKQTHKFVKAVEKVGLTVKNASNSSPLNLLLNFGKTVSKEFTDAYILDNKFVRAKEEGIFYIHNLDNYALSTTHSSCLDLSNITSNDILSSTLQLIKIIKNIKEEQCGEQILPDIDIFYDSVIITNFRQKFYSLLTSYLNIKGFKGLIDFNSLENQISNLDIFNKEDEWFNSFCINNELENIVTISYNEAKSYINNTLKDALSLLFKEINDLHYYHNNNKVTISTGLGNSFFNTIFFQVLNEFKLNNIFINYKIFKDNYDIELIKDTIESHNKINLIIIDSNQDKEYFSTGVSAFTTNDTTPFSKGKILLTTTTINLAKIGLKYQNGSLKDFYNELESVMELTKNQLLQRFEIQSSKYKENYQYLFSDSLIYDSKKLEENQKIRKVIKSGILNIGFIGLAECVCALKNKNSIEVKDLDLVSEILKFMNNLKEKFINETKLNFALTETQNQKALKSLITIDKIVYGLTPILNKESYSLFNEMLLGIPPDEKIKFLSKMQKYCDIAITYSKKDNLNELIASSITNHIPFLIGKYNDN